MKKVIMSNKTIQDQQIPRDWIHELQAEVAAWRKKLNSRMEENVSMKNNIAEILKEEYDQYCLNEIEDFQTNSIREDEIIGILRMEVAELDDLLTNNNLDSMKLKDSLDETIKKLRNDMTYSENQFDSFISSFRDFQQKICTEKEN